MRRFKRVYIEITNVCNLSCSFCPKTKRTSTYMDKELFLKILNQIQGSAKHVYFHVLGEPLLHPEIEHFLELCGDYSLLVNITTNGTLIAGSKEKLLNKRALRQINFSLHSFEANINRYSIDQYLHGIFDFIHEAQTRANIQFCLRLWNLKEGRNNESNSYILRKLENEFSLDYRIDQQLTPCNGLKIGKNVFLNQAMTFKWPDLEDYDIEGKGFCYGLREQIAILADGTVVPCCLDGEGIISLGNINVLPLAEILETERTKAMYEGFSRRDVIEPLCKKCQYRLRFNPK